MARTLLVLEHVTHARASDAIAVLFAAAAAAAVLASGCAGTPTTVDDAPAPTAAASCAPRGRRPLGADAARVAPRCEAPTPLDVHHDAQGHVDILHAYLTARGVEGPFLVDTGSQRSFVIHDGDERGTSATTVISCKETELPIIARLQPRTAPDGRPRAGVLGVDLLAHGEVMDLDLAKGQLAWYSPAPRMPAGAVVVPVEYRKGWLVASGIRVNGRDVKLVIDTGAQNVILVDDVARPGETREETFDGTSSPITLFHADGVVTYADGVRRRVPVDRTDAFPTLQGLIATLGNDVSGILGMSALGRERVILDRESMILVLPPLAPIPL